MFRFLTFFVFFIAAVNCVAKEQNTANEAEKDFLVPPINEAQFVQKTQKGIVLVDFWATWCSPCHTQAAILYKVAKEFEGKVSFFKVDVDDNPKISQKYEIEAIPSLIIFKDGVPVKKLVGVQKKRKLKRLLSKHL